MTTKPASTSLTKQDAKYAALMAEYQREVKLILADLKRSRDETKRLKASSERKLARIDLLLTVFKELFELIRSALPCTVMFRKTHAISPSCAATLTR
jgi:hypothetical protein